MSMSPSGVVALATASSSARGILTPLRFQLAEQPPQLGELVPQGAGGRVKAPPLGRRFAHSLEVDREVDRPDVPAALAPALPPASIEVRAVPLALGTTAGWLAAPHQLGAEGPPKGGHHTHRTAPFLFDHHGWAPFAA
jgi:hypothetical protein